MLACVPASGFAKCVAFRSAFEVPLGLYLSAHPLDSYANQLDRLRITTHAMLTKAVVANRPPQRLNLAGLVTSKQVRVSQRGNRFAFVQFTDQTGVFEATFFSAVLAEASDLLDSGKPLLISVNLKIEDNISKTKANSI